MADKKSVERSSEEVQWILEHREEMFYIFMSGLQKLLDNHDRSHREDRKLIARLRAENDRLRQKAKR